MFGKTNKGLIYFFGALGGMLYGYDTGVISGALLFIQKDIPLTSFMQGFVVSALLIGAIVGAGLSGPLSDRWGRRRVVLVISIVYIIGSLAAAFSPNATALVISRIILGLAVGGSTALVPVYLAEMAPTHVRGSLGSLNQLMITIGILVAYIINYAFTPIEGWRWMLGLAVVPAIILLIGVAFMPESPRWLIKKNREKEAREVMKLTREENEIENEIHEMLEAEKDQETAWSLLKARWVRPMLIVGIVLAIFQQIIGINAIIYYAPTIFNHAGLGSSASILGTVGIGIVNVLLTLVAIAVIDKLGRKKLMLWGNVGMVISLVVIASILSFAGLSTSTAWVTVVFLGLFIVFFAATWGPAVWVILPELFPLKARGAGTGITTLFLSLGNLVVSFLFPILLGAIGIVPLFFIFAAIGVLAFIFVAIFVPETKGRSLEEIEFDLRKKFGV
ncbi:sugar porter (SP) family MFS transporter [Scopulibacillus daqui]|uniref:Sugar porter (SP) family MFS transporter n=1 Tax=Scopulibacillus daqui TaxID=1469162 RepID=A0ABS2Q2W0_9BACL|nr:sugar porter family MFS transporter [Scopulibacillus daqui]MBM7646637.1 sugar porter (SP) family MFS transporter [Scopulibacillus daqui]